MLTRRSVPTVGVGGDLNGAPVPAQDALHTSYATRKAINDKLAEASAPPAAPAPVRTAPAVVVMIVYVGTTRFGSPSGSDLSYQTF